MDADIIRLVGQMHGQINALRTVLAMSIAADRNVRAILLANLPKVKEIAETDPRNWETELDKLASEGYLRIIDVILEMLEEAQETAP
ncbi:MAG: hypothetical protein OXF97_03020 [Nitrospira sp.]|nr:hypothetical protein [Nitrospira sp.]